MAQVQARTGGLASLATQGSARKASPTLSRRDSLKLVAAGAAAWALPTFHLASADGPEVGKPARAGRIYFLASLRSGPGGEAEDFGIFAIDPETERWIKVGGEFEGNGIRVSPDGRTLALSRAGWTGVPMHEIDNVGLWTLDSEGKGEKRRVAEFGGTVSWSPDSKQLIVTKWWPGPKDDRSRHETWRFNSDGSAATKLPIPETDGVEDWSPDGHWIVTVTDRHPPHGSGYQIYVMRPDGSDQHRLTEGNGLNFHPRFSPDNRRVAYLHHERSGTGLWVVNIDGSSRRRVLQFEDDTITQHFCWSPDGKSLAYEMAYEKGFGASGKGIDGESTKPRFWIIDAENANRHPLTLPRAKWVNDLDWR